MLKTLLQHPYARATAILIGSLLFANLIHFVLKIYMQKITAKTKNDIDDDMVKIIITPLYLFMIVSGVYISLQSLSIASQHTWIKNVYVVVNILIVFWVISKILTLLVHKWLRVHKRFERTPVLITKIITVVTWILAVLLILDYFNIEITPLMATLGIGGIAVGLALQNTLSNFFAGLHIISDQPIRVGDFIELDGNVSGYVEDIGWRSTRIRTLPNTLVIVPNSKLAESTIINDSLPEQEMAALVQVGVDYGSDLKKVEKITVHVAQKIQQTVSGAVKTFEPFIRYHTLGDSNINFTVILRVEKFVDKYLVTHEFIKALKKRYDQEGIEISWPVRKVYYVKKKS